MNCVVSVAVGVTEGQGVLKRGKRLLALKEAKKKRKKPCNLIKSDSEVQSKGN